MPFWFVGQGRRGSFLAGRVTLLQSPVSTGPARLSTSATGEPALSRRPVRSRLGLLSGERLAEGRGRIRPGGATVSRGEYFGRKRCFVWESRIQFKEFREGDCGVSTIAARASSGQVCAMPACAPLGTLQGWKQRPGYSRVVRVGTRSAHEPVTAEAHYWLGMAYLSTKQLDEARAQFERVLAEWPSLEVECQAILRLGGTYEDQGHSTQAIDTYTRLTATGTA